MSGKPGPQQSSLSRMLLALNLQVHKNKDGLPAPAHYQERKALRSGVKWSSGAKASPAAPVSRLAALLSVVPWLGWGRPHTRFTPVAGRPARWKSLGRQKGWRGKDMSLCAWVSCAYMFLYVYSVVRIYVAVPVCSVSCVCSCYICAM